MSFMVHKLQPPPSFHHILVQDVRQQFLAQIWRGYVRKHFKVGTHFLHWLFGSIWLRRNFCASIFFLFTSFHSLLSVAHGTYHLAGIYCVSADRVLPSSFAYFSSNALTFLSHSRGQKYHGCHRKYPLIG